MGAVMHWTGLLSLLCLALTGVLATWGVFSRHFDDSLLQRIGLATLAIACILRVPDRIYHPHTPPELLMAQVGLAVYGIGTAIKLWRKTRAATRRERRGLGVGI